MPCLRRSLATDTARTMQIFLPSVPISCTTSVPRPIKFHGTCLTAALLNSQSARNKVDLISEAVIDHDINILALTETWLTNTPKDEYYTKELSFSGYKLINVPHPGDMVEESQSYTKTVFQLKLWPPLEQATQLLSTVICSSITNLVC